MAEVIGSNLLNAPIKDNFGDSFSTGMRDGINLAKAQEEIRESRIKQSFEKEKIEALKDEKLFDVLGKISSSKDKTAQNIYYKHFLSLSERYGRAVNKESLDYITKTEEGRAALAKSLENFQNLDFGDPQQKLFYIRETVKSTGLPLDEVVQLADKIAKPFEEQRKLRETWGSRIEVEKQKSIDAEARKKLEEDSKNKRQGLAQDFQQALSLMKRSSDALKAIGAPGEEATKFTSDRLMSDRAGFERDLTLLESKVGNLGRQKTETDIEVKKSSAEDIKKRDKRFYAKLSQDLKIADRRAKVAELASQRALKRMDIKNIGDLQRDFKNDSAVKNINESVSAAETIAGLLDSADRGNPLATEAIQTQFAKLAGDKGALSNQDINRWGGSKAIDSRIERWIQKNLDGTLDVKDRKSMRDLVGTFKEANSRKLRKKGEEYASVGSVRLSIPKEEALKYLVIEDRTGIIPKAAGGKQASKPFTAAIIQKLGKAGAKKFLQDKGFIINEGDFQ